MFGQFRPLTFHLQRTSFPHYLSHLYSTVHIHKKPFNHATPTSKPIKNVKNATWEKTKFTYFSSRPCKYRCMWILQLFPIFPITKAKFTHLLGKRIKRSFKGTMFVCVLNSRKLANLAQERMLGYQWRWHSVFMRNFKNRPKI